MIICSNNDLGLEATKCLQKNSHCVKKKQAIDQLLILIELSQTVMVAGGSSGEKRNILYWIENIS